MSEETLDPGTRIDATIVLRRPERTIDPKASREEVEQALTADPADMETVRQFASAHDLHIDRESAAERSVWVSGTASQMHKAFGVQFSQIGEHIALQGAFALPPELSSVAVAVLGLDKQPIAKPH